jgi:hypothetical protein
MKRKNTEDRSSIATFTALHSTAALRALDASSELIELLKGCERAIQVANLSVEKDALEIVARISQSVAGASELAELLQYRVKQSADDRSGFWEPAADPCASICRSLARRVRSAA